MKCVHLTAINYISFCLNFESVTPAGSLKLSQIFHQLHFRLEMIFEFEWNELEIKVRKNHRKLIYYLLLQLNFVASNDSLFNSSI